MFKVLINCAICATMLLGGNMQTKSIQEYLISSAQACIVVDKSYYNVEDLKELNDVLNDMLHDSHTMPAFGVSIHTETLKAMQKGVWLKLQYNGTQYVLDMPFDELLIKVQPDFRGFNIIRGNKGIYDGRCYYIDLVNNTMQPLYDFVTSKFNKV